MSNKSSVISDTDTAGKRLGNRLDAGIKEKDKLILRKLAEKVAELASLPEQEEKRKLWYKHNDLGATRPLILCDPENGWCEIIREEQLECEDEMARRWEVRLRKLIFWGNEMGDDRVIEEYFDLGYVYDETDWGMHEIRMQGENRGSFRWEEPLKDYKDFNKLHFPKITVDYEKTEEIVNIAKEIFDGLLTVRIKGGWWWSLGLTYTLVLLRGMENVMLDMYDNPEELHKLMAFLRDGHMAKIDFLEAEGLLTLNGDGIFVGSHSHGYTHQLPQKDYVGTRIRTCDMWGFGESQETVSVSPEMFEEFIFPYQLPILKRFGMNYYGCCEPLNKRWDIISKIPSLRKVSVSPWADLEDMASKLQNKYVYSMKPNPAYLATSNLDKEYIRKSLREVFKITKDCRVEVVMKDNNTIGNNPQNVIDWCRIAREEAEVL